MYLFIVIFRPTFQQIAERLDRIVGSNRQSYRKEEEEDNLSSSSSLVSPHSTHTGGSATHSNITGNSFHVVNMHPSSTVKEYLREVEMETVHSNNTL